jgi:tripartite-type tricarboxylate transporter receptor subunit TctC
MIKNRTLSGVLSGCIMLLAGPSYAFPDKPVTLVIPFSPGGSGDVVSRTIADRLSAQWGQPVIVDNRPGAGGAIGTVYVNRQPADGYTILMHSPAIMVSTELLRSNSGYQIFNDFTPITEVFRTPVVLVASNKTHSRDAISFFEEARKNADFSFASHGNGSSTQYLGEQLKASIGIPLIHIPVSGEAQMITNIIGGHVTSGFMSVSGAHKAVNSGSAWAVASTGTSRWPSLPQTPTFRELGFQGGDRMSGMSYFVRKSTPREIFDQLERDMALAINDSKTAEAAATLGVSLVSTTSEHALESLKAEYSDWQVYIKKFGNLTQ